MPIRTFLRELIPRSRQNFAPRNGRKPKSEPPAHICRMEEVETYWFCANIQLRTPLAVLEKHGAFHPGPPSQLPPYGAAKDGKWIPLYKLKLTDARSAHVSQSNEVRPLTGKNNAQYTASLPSYIDSDIGPIPSTGGEYLHFVKAFRRIIEENDVTDVTIAKLKALLQHGNVYRVFARKHAPDFVMLWFLNALLAIPGLDPNAAQRLFTAGYRTIDELRVANELVLRERAQIDEATFAKIRGFVGSLAPLEQREAAA